MLPVIEQAHKNLNKLAIFCEGEQFTYAQLVNESGQLANSLLLDKGDLNEERIAFMVNPGFNYVKTLWAIWQAGGIAVPLCITHPLPSLAYVLEDAGASVLIISNEYLQVLQSYIDNSNIKVIIVDEQSPAVNAMNVRTNILDTHSNDLKLPNIELSRKALILYTSGTTNKPKGVVTTHENITAQITTLIHAWEWSENDNTICVLPLHHVHGIINVVCCSLWAGATCTFVPQFAPKNIFNLFKTNAINVFMAVPTIYFKLMTYLETISKEEQAVLKNLMSQFRLMVCGSAALPVSVMERWEQYSGQRLLERYGMTELGMAISNPYHGERKAGYVGLPLPGVSIKLVNEQYEEVPLGEPGEIIVSGKNVFLAYWQKPEATQESFTKEGWFKTGDIAVVEDGYYRIMGRSSVDIIKSGGYKISALEIEEVLREHEYIADCAVVGIPNDEWGELIVASLVLNEVEKFDEKILNEWFVQKMAAYKKPRKYLILQELPRNAMGKVVKNEVKKLFE
jgi:malonyl-CoA/methylmalonyl-CoA synthetase